MIKGTFYVITDVYRLIAGSSLKSTFPLIKALEYLYTMYLKKRTAYLLFFIAYVGALLIDKPSYSISTVRGCFSYLFTIIVHFSLFSLMLYVNYRVLIPRMLEKSWFSAYAGSLLLLITVYSTLIGHYNAFIHDRLFHDELVRTHAGFWDNFIYGLCCTLIASMLYLTQRWTEQREQMKNSQINQLQTELKYLRSQLNPHFLFNGLNTVYGYIDRGNSKARDIMVQFSDLLRYNLYEADVDMIALNKEVKYLQNYVDLQKARSNDNVKVELKLDYQDGQVKVAPLIFMTFVENAFKHVSRGDDINNSINIILAEKDGRLTFTCVNSYEQTEPATGGIGLNNAIRRLDLLYKNRYQLEITNVDQQYKVHLILTL